MKQVASWLAVLTVGAVAIVSAAQQDFVLENKTGMTIDELYVTPAHAKKWGEDVLGKDVLNHTERVPKSRSRARRPTVSGI